MIERTSYRYGAMHAELKRHGFKSEFWVPMADLIFSEAVRLDLANHQVDLNVSKYEAHTFTISKSFQSSNKNFSHPIEFLHNNEKYKICLYYKGTTQVL